MSTPEQALHDLTLALLYLTRQANTKNSADFWKVNDFRSWKSYDWDVMDKLDEEELIVNVHRNKSVIITEDGVRRARDILEQYGIEDWKNRINPRENLLWSLVDKFFHYLSSL